MAADTILVKRIICVALFVVFLLCGIDTTESHPGRHLTEPTIIVKVMLGVLRLINLNGAFKLDL